MMKQIFKKRWIRYLTFLGLFLGISSVGGVGFALLKPKEALTFVVNHLSKSAHFSAESVEWKGSQCLVVSNAKLSDWMAASQVVLVWEWKGLWHRRLKELNIVKPQIFMDLEHFSSMGKGSEKIEGAGANAIGAPPWFLDKLVMKRGGLMVVGLGKTVPSLQMEIEGEFDDVPLGDVLTREQLAESRTIRLKKIHIHSPVDLAATVLKVDQIEIGFHMGGLKERRLDLLIFHRPVLDIDRGFFWFIDTLRKEYASTDNSSQVSSPGGGEWRVKLFKIVDGKLDINRLKEIKIQYPFGFETTKEDMPLKNLSLTDFAIDLDIHPQDLHWAAKEIYLENIRGKINLQLGKVQSSGSGAPSGAVRPPNDLVNTLYVDAIRWKKHVIREGWISLTFSPESISGSYGGAFADGYLNGGVAAGWTGLEKWRAWGSAADVDVKVVSDAFANESYAMNGRASMVFDVEGHQSNLVADLKLNSISTGLIEIRSMDELMKKVEAETSGMKKEMLEAVVSSLRDYPYDQYELNIHYRNPDAALTLRSNGKLGARKLDLFWHGLKL